MKENQIKCNLILLIVNIVNCIVMAIPGSFVFSTEEAYCYESYLNPNCGLGILPLIAYGFSFFGIILSAQILLKKQGYLPLCGVNLVALITEWGACGGSFGVSEPGGSMLAHIPPILTVCAILLAWGCELRFVPVDDV